MLASKTESDTLYPFANASTVRGSSRILWLAEEIIFIIAVMTESAVLGRMSPARVPCGM